MNQITLILCAAALCQNAICNAQLFSDNFDDGDADGWQEIDGTFGVTSNGTYEVKSLSFANDARSVNGDPAWTNYAFDADFTFSSGHAALLFRVETIASGTDAGRYYQFHIFPQSAGFCSMNFSGGNCQRLIDVPHATTLGEWHHARIEIFGATATAYIDGIRVLTYNGFTRYPAGRIGVKRINGGVAQYDNVVVTSFPPDCPPLSIRVTEVELCLKTTFGQAYQLQYRSELSTNEWMSLYGTNIIGTGESVCYREQVSQPERFYRLHCVTNDIVK